jgi:uncharacterized protein (DUF58 family)
VERFIPPKKGRGHVWRLIQEILTFQPEHKGTDLVGALEYAGHLLRKKTVLFLISDFLDTGYSRSLVLASKRHDITAIRVRDPREDKLEAVGLLPLEDSETGRVQWVDTSSRKVREHFEKQARLKLEESKDILRRSGVDEVEVMTTGSSVDPLMRYFRNRDRRR